MKRAVWILTISLFFNSNLKAGENDIAEIGAANKHTTRFLNFAENSKRFSEWCTSNFNEQEQKYISNPTRLNFLKSTYDYMNGNDVVVFLNRSKIIDNEIIRLKKRKNVSEINLRVLKKLQSEIYEVKKQKLMNWLVQKIGLEQEHTEKVMQNRKKILFLIDIWEKAESKNARNIAEAKKILKSKLLSSEKQMMRYPLNISEENVKDVQLLEGISLYLENVETEQQQEHMEEAKSGRITNGNAMKQLWQSGMNLFSNVLKIGAYTVGAPVVIPFIAIKKAIKTGMGLVPLYKKLTKNTDERKIISSVTKDLETAGKIYKGMGKGTSGTLAVLASYISVPAFVLAAPGIYNWCMYREAYSPTWDLFKHYFIDKFITYKIKIAAKTFITTGGLALITVCDDLFKMLPEKIKFGQKDVLGIYRLVKGAISNKIDAFSEILTIYLNKEVPARYRLMKINEKFWDAIFGNGFYNWITEGGGRVILEKAKIMPVLQTIGGFYKWLYYASGKILKTVIETPFNLLEKRPWI